MTRLLPLLLLGIPACGPSAPPQPPQPPEPVVASVAPKSIASNPEPPRQVESKPVPSAAVEVAPPVADALRPKAAPWVDARVQSPRPRSSAAERGELPLAKPATAVAPIPLPVRKPSLPAPPSEGVPPRVGEGAGLDWRGAKLPESPGVKAPPRPEPTAADVPRLGYPVPDRIPTDDPTAEISTARIVNTLMTAPTIAVPFLRLVLPDPFEFADQVKTPPSPEFATRPVIVPMARP